MRQCWVHRRPNNRAVTRGFFYHDGITPQHAWARFKTRSLFLEGQVLRRKIHKAQQNQDLAGRYFGISRRGTVHLCTCRWTQKQIDQAKAKTHKFTLRGAT